MEALWNVFVSETIAAKRDGIGRRHVGIDLNVVVLGNRFITNNTKGKMTFFGLFLGYVVVTHLVSIVLLAKNAKLGPLFSTEKPSLAAARNAK